MIRIITRTGALLYLPFSRYEIICALQAMLNTMNMPDAHVELLLTDDAESAHLNLTFLGCIGPTNILAFPADPEIEAPFAPPCKETTPQTRQADSTPSLGLLALSTPAVQRESFLYGRVPAEHSIRLLAHGLLHLAGYQHGVMMDDMTDELLATALRTQSVTPSFIHALA